MESKRSQKGFCKDAYLIVATFKKHLGHLSQSPRGSVRRLWPNCITLVADSSETLSATRGWDPH